MAYDRFYDPARKNFLRPKSNGNRFSTTDQNDPDVQDKIEKFEGMVTDFGTKSGGEKITHVCEHAYMGEDEL